MCGQKFYLLRLGLATDSEHHWRPFEYSFFQCSCPYRCSCNQQSSPSLVQKLMFSTSNLWPTHLTKSSIFARVRLTIVIIGLTVLAGISKLTHTRVVIEPILHQKNESCISSDWSLIIHQSVVFMLLQRRMPYSGKGRGHSH